LQIFRFDKVGAKPPFYVLDSFSKFSICGLNIAMFIVLEGLDKSGKTTLADKLKCHYGNSCVVYAFPDRTTEIGKILHKHLSGTPCADTVAQLLFAANRHELLGKMRKDLSSGLMVICDRYSGSGLAYGGNIAYEQGLLTPDVVLYMESESKETVDGEITEKKEVQDKAKKIFESLADREKWVRINNLTDFEAICAQLEKCVKK
jgi:dTMP kinase